MKLRRKRDRGDIHYGFRPELRLRAEESAWGGGPERVRFEYEWAALSQRNEEDASYCIPSVRDPMRFTAWNPCGAGWPEEETTLLLVAGILGAIRRPGPR